MLHAAIDRLRFQIDDELFDFYAKSGKLVALTRFIVSSPVGDPAFVNAVAAPRWPGWTVTRNPIVKPRRRT